jgi:hypothetical protein
MLKDDVLIDVPGFGKLNFLNLSKNEAIGLTVGTVIVSGGIWYLKRKYKNFKNIPLLNATYVKTK